MADYLQYGALGVLAAVLVALATFAGVVARSVATWGQAFLEELREAKEALVEHNATMRATLDRVVVVTGKTSERLEEHDRDMQIALALLVRDRETH